MLLKLFGIDKRNDKASLHDNQFPHSISTGKHQDLVKNLELLVDEGNYAACYDLGQLYYHGGNGMEKDIRKAILYFIKAADNGIPEAAYQLGKIYETGVENVLTADQRLSFEWYTRAAEACIPEAENNLGSCYFFGRGVDVDYDRIVFDTYDYLDKIIGFKLSDIFYAFYKDKNILLDRVSPLRYDDIELYTLHS